MTTLAYTDGDFDRLSPFFREAAAALATPLHSASDIEATMYLELCDYPNAIEHNQPPADIAERMACCALARLHKEDRRNALYSEIAAALQDSEPSDVPITGICFDAPAAVFYQGVNWEEVAQQMNERLQAVIHADPVLMGLVARYRLVIVEESRLSASAAA